MKPLMQLRNEKGFALISMCLVSIIMLAISATASFRSYVEGVQVQREFTKLSGQYAAEGGIQKAMQQIGNNAYTGFIDSAAISLGSFSNAAGSLTIGSVTVDISYPSQADWVIVQSEATVSGQKVKLEGRIFLDSNLSKYMMYSPATTHGYGANLTIGYADTSTGASSVGVPANDLDRNLMYYTGSLAWNGSGITVYGDIHVQGSVNGNNNNGKLYGDAYVGSYTSDSSGVTEDGFSSSTNMTIGDGFSDDLDRNSSGSVTSADAPDIHDLTSDGASDSRKTETLTAIDTSFYQAHNNVSAYYGASATNRFLKLEVAANGTSTKIVEYTNANFTTTTGTTYNLPDNAIVCVNGSAYIKGEIKGRVSIVATNDIMFAGNVKYSASSNYVTESQAAAFLAQDKIYFLPSSLEVSGIIFAEKSATGSNAVTAAYKLGSDGSSLVDDNGAKTNGHFRHYGNIIMEEGTISTSQYVNDRAFYYDSQMKYYRPPGLPVIPSLRMVRENAPSA